MRPRRRIIARRADACRVQSSSLRTGVNEFVTRFVRTSLNCATRSSCHWVPSARCGRRRHRSLRRRSLADRRDSSRRLCGIDVAIRQVCPAVPMHASYSALLFPLPLIFRLSGCFGPADFLQHGHGNRDSPRRKGFPHLLVYRPDDHIASR
jgi:hypothetical protein